MIHAKARYLELKGTNYEIGRKSGQLTAMIPALKAFQTSGWDQFGEQDALLAKELFDRWCPGLNEEIRGFADALGIAPGQVTYYAMTYLKPRCSQIVILPALTRNEHILLARNYEFSHTAEDFALTRTSVTGKYSHLGTSVMQLGRDEGLNECGLGVSMSSCGFPVGALNNMRNPALRGLQFWAVIRTLLENCRDVNEALSFLKGMPIAYNINLMLADRSGNAALVETVDGRIAIRQIDGNGQPQYLHATNHVVLPELKPYEPNAMRNSIHRYEYSQQFLNKANYITIEDLKTLLLGQYPEGLCCHYYDDFMGTTKSIIMDLNDGQIELCWGGLAKNGWRSYSVNQPLDDSWQSIEIIPEQCQPGLFDFVTA